MRLSARLTNHARERLAERFHGDAEWLTEQLLECEREQRYSRHMPKWLARQYGVNRLSNPQANRRFVRLDDDGVPAVAIVVLEPDAIVVVTVIRKNERAQALATFHAGFKSADGAPPGARRRYAARRGEDRSA